MWCSPRLCAWSIEFCIYTIPLGAILKYHKINYHIYADDTQIYCSFEIDSLNEVLDRVIKCISDIRSWMIMNKLKINDDKTEFLLITSPRAKITRDIQISIGQEENLHHLHARVLGLCLINTSPWIPTSLVSAALLTFT